MLKPAGQQWCSKQNLEQKYDNVSDQQERQEETSGVHRIWHQRYPMIIKSLMLKRSDADDVHEY